MKQEIVTKKGKKLKYIATPLEVTKTNNDLSYYWKVVLKYNGKQFTTKIGTPTQQPLVLQDVLSLLVSQCNICSSMGTVAEAMSFFEKENDREEAKRLYAYYRRSLDGMYRLFKEDGTIIELLNEFS